MDSHTISKEALELCNKLKNKDQNAQSSNIKQLAFEGVEFFKKIRNAVVMLEDSSEHELTKCTVIIFGLFLEFIDFLGLDLQEGSNQPKVHLYGLQTLCNISTRFASQCFELFKKIDASQGFFRFLEACSKYLPIEDAQKLTVVQIVLINNIVTKSPLANMQFINSPRSRCLVLNLIKAYPLMNKETQELCDELVKTLIEGDFLEAIFTELSPERGFMSELQFEILSILCHSKSAPSTFGFYDTLVNLFGETIELVNVLTLRVKDEANSSTELDKSLQILHDQVKVWMEWFYIASDPESNFGKIEEVQAISSRLLENLLRLLQILETNIPKIVTLKDSKGFTPSHLTMTTAKTWVLRVINNLIYDNFEMQNLVRHQNYLPLILNQCNIDDNNPYLRELGIFAVRNLTSNNSENAELVKALSPRGAAPSPVLEELGLETVTDSDGLPQVVPKRR